MLINELVPAGLKGLITAGMLAAPLAFAPAITFIFVFGVFWPGSPTRESWWADSAC